MQVKMLFSKNNTRFTYIIDTLDPSQVPVMQVKVMIGNKKSNFYLHDRHLTWLLYKQK